MGRPKGSPSINKTAPPRGRPKGSLDRAQRQLVSNELAHSIMGTFVALGGTQAMIEWAEENKTIFYTQILSRLFPAPQKETEDGPLININLGDVNAEIEAGRRIAFAMARAAHLLGEDPVKDRVPYAHLAAELDAK